MNKNILIKKNSLKKRQKKIVFCQHVMCPTIFFYLKISMRKEQCLRAQIIIENPPNLIFRKGITFVYHRWPTSHSKGVIIN